MIEVVDYDDDWPLLFDQLRTQYERLLLDVRVVSIEHVGSTSVSGLAAKPVVDVDIVVRREDVEAALASLVAAGFESRGDLGIIDRFAVRAPDGWVATNTYVVVEGSLALRNHLAVRAVLRSDPALRDEYGRLKRQLAGLTDDIEAYVDGKSPLLQEILERAGLSETELVEIAAANLTSREPVRE